MATATASKVSAQTTLDLSDLPEEIREQILAELIKKKEAAKTEYNAAKTGKDIDSVLTMKAAEGKTITVADMLKAFHALATWKDIQALPAHEVFKIAKTGGSGSKPVSAADKARAHDVYAWFQDQEEGKGFSGPEVMAGVRLKNMNMTRNALNILRDEGKVYTTGIVASTRYFLKTTNTGNK